MHIIYMHVSKSLAVQFFLFFASVKHDLHKTQPQHRPHLIILQSSLARVKELAWIFGNIKLD